MKISYFMAVGTLCVALNGAGARAETVEAALAKENIHAVAVATYKRCPVDHHPSKYLDNIYRGTYCYGCINDTKWNNNIQKCF